MDNKQTTQLCAATLLGNEPIVKLRLHRGVHINPLKNVSRSALHEAARRGQHITVQLLLDKGTKVNLVNNYGWTPLHNACNEGKKRTVKFLLKKGANLDLKKKGGSNTFGPGQKHSHNKVTNLLLEDKKVKSHRPLPKLKD